MFDWKKMEALTDRMVVGGFSELVQHRPIIASSGLADPSRPVAEIKAVLHTPAAAGAINLGSGIITTLSASEGALVVNRALYPTIIFKARDKIRGLDLPGQPLWEIRTVNDRFASVLVLVLTQA